jgi:hypothetical protein
VSDISLIVDGRQERKRLNSAVCGAKRRFDPFVCAGKAFLKTKTYLEAHLIRRKLDTKIEDRAGSGASSAIKNRRINPFLKGYGLRHAANATK